jgi:hypothetical protein
VTEIIRGHKLNPKIKSQGTEKGWGFLVLGYYIYLQYAAKNSLCIMHTCKLCVKFWQSKYIQMLSTYRYIYRSY